MRKLHAQTILHAMREKSAPMTVSDLSDATSIAREAVATALTKMMKAGAVRRVDRMDRAFTWGKLTALYEATDLLAKQRIQEAAHASIAGEEWRSVTPPPSYRGLIRWGVEIEDWEIGSL